MKKIVVFCACLVLVFVQQTSPPMSRLHEVNAAKVSFPLLVHSFCNGCLLTFEKIRGASSYQIYRSEKDGDLKPKIVTSETMFLDSGEFKEGVVYTYVVAALDKQGKELCRSIAGIGTLLCPTQICSVKLKYQVGNYMYWVDEKQDGPMNAAPEVIQGRMFLVIRYITSEVGAKLDWDSAQKKVTITTWDATMIELWIDKPGAKIDGKDIMIDPKNDQVVPYIKNGRTMLPMRFVAENLGCKNIDWNATSQTVALLMPKPNCIDDGMFPLTVESYDAYSGKMSCIADFGAKLDVTVTQDQKENAKALAKGQRIIVTSSTASQNDEKIDIIARELKPVAQTEKRVFGALKEAKDVDTEWIGCDGKTFKLKWGLSRMGLMSIPKGIQLWLTTNKDVIVDYLVSTFEQPCKDKPNTIANLRIIELDCKGKVALCENLEGNEVIYLYSDRTSEGFCDLKPKQCYKVECAQDQFGRLLQRTAEDQGCPCSFVLTVPAKLQNVPKGGDFEFNFTVTNNEIETKSFKTLLKTEEFAGKVSVYPEFADINPGNSKTFVANGKLLDDLEGETSLEVGASCGQTKQFEKIHFKVFEPMLEVSEPIGILAAPKEDQLFFSVIVKNTSVFGTNCTFFLDKGNAVVDLKVTPSSQLIKSLSEAKITVKGTWEKGAVVGMSYYVNLVAKCGVKEFRKRLTLSVRRGGPSVFLEKTVCDNDGKCILLGDIDWKVYDPKSITINWGDNTIDVVRTLPAYHTYSSKGVYNIKVIATAKTEETGEAEITVEYEGIKPIVTVISHDFVQTGPHLFRLILEGTIDWRGLTKKKIEFDWGDGAKSEGNFPQVHDYTYGYYVLVISAEATTGEIGYFRVNVNIGLY